MGLLLEQDTEESEPYAVQGGRWLKLLQRARSV